MSTMTLRKRIALVAVAALGAGVLSVAPANASDTTVITADNIAITVPTANTTAALGVCKVDTTGTVSSGTVIARGATLTFTTTTNGTGALSVTGPATLSTASTDADYRVNSTSTAVMFKEIGAVARVTANAVGSVVVTAFNSYSLTASSGAVETYGITVVESCAANAMSVANSIAVLGASDTTAAAGDVDFAGTTFSEIDNGSELWINVLLRDSYKDPLTTAGVLTATATNGARIGWVTGGSTAGPFAAATAIVATLGDSTASESLKIMQPTGSSAALSTTVTIQFNGVTVATKNVRILGAAASIAVTDVTVGTQGSTGTFKYVVRDAAGNQLTDTSVATAANTGFVSGGVVASATTASPGDATMIAKGTGTFACAANKSGSQSVTIAFLNSALKPVASNAFTATCGYAAVDTYTVSLDKAVYAPGEIATLTISAKDEKGGIVSDTTTVGANVVNVAMPGMTSIGAAPTTADVFTSGVKTYKFRVDQAEGSFVGQAQVDAATDLAVKTVSYKIAAGTGVVSNADVLKAIVSLIASINKQIAALQKALLRR